MSAPANASPKSLAEAPAAVPALMRATQPLYWSVRRELWEHRSVFIAPLAAAGVVLFGFIVSTPHLPQNARAVLSAMDPMKRQMLLFIPYVAAAVSIMATGLIVAVFYSLGALHNERRDRSILFWKSLPVSDLTTVLSKASIPLVVLPLIVFAIVAAAQIIMLAVSAAVVAAALGVGMGSTPLAMLHLMIVELYTVVVFSLWLAPVFGWLFLVSAWARRVVFLWAVLPPLALGVIEHIAFDTGYVARLLVYRLGGGVIELAYRSPSAGKPVIDAWTGLDPIRFFTSAGLWLGLGVAAALFAGAIWLRRYREPI